MSRATQTTGTLVLVPNALDFGASEPGDLTAALPLPVLQRAATIAHWVVEDAKSARAFLRRVAAVAPLRLPIQQLDIQELPRADKSAERAAAKATVSTAVIHLLLAPARNGADVALLTEAGLPAVADPGAALVREAHTLGLRVEPLPGPSALMLALAASGLNGQQFAFVGYLPVNAEERAHRIRELETQSRRAHQTQIAIETPYRNTLPRRQHAGLDGPPVVGRHAGVQQGVGMLGLHGAMISEAGHRPQVQMGRKHSITGRERGC